MANYANAYEGRSGTFITDITADSEQNVDIEDNEVVFTPYNNPDVSADTSSRFAVHEIIGGKTVRQKIGEDPMEIEIDGVCTEDVAGDVDELRNAKLVTLISDRFNSGGLRCQVASSSTNPLSAGGAADMDGGDMLYSYTINLVEVDVQIGGVTGAGEEEISGSGSGGIGQNEVSNT